MPGRNKNKRGGGNNDDFKKKECNVAVIMADSFTTRFQPITLTTPKVLLPLVNAPMLEYTLEFLCSNGVQEVLIYCASHAQQIKDYIDDSKWTKLGKSFKLDVIVNVNSRTEGDALRHLDELEIIKGEFILVSGDVVSSINLKSLLAQHKRRAKADPRGIMTMVLKQADHNSRTRTLDDDLVVVLSEGANAKQDDDDSAVEVLLYNNDVQTEDVTFNLDLLDESAENALRYDLMDCHIYICNPQVLMLFTENFDYDDIRDDFIRGVIEDNILGNRLYGHVIKHEYAARCKNLRTYDSISKDIVHRWTYPMVPDTNLLSDTNYSLSRGNVYKEKKVSLDRCCNLSRDVVLGANTSIGKNSQIIRSVLGRNVRIGDNVRIENSYIWSDCVIEDGVTVESSILANRAVVKANASIAKGCVIGYDVVVGQGVSIPAQSKVSMHTTEGGSAIGNDADSKGLYFWSGLDDEVVVVREVPATATDAKQSSFPPPPTPTATAASSTTTSAMSILEVTRGMLNSLVPHASVGDISVHSVDDKLEDF
jgi:translation initiation factor eIF-2B subunit epsilon